MVFGRSFQTQIYDYWESKQICFKINNHEGLALRVLTFMREEIVELALGELASAEPDMNRCFLLINLKLSFLLDSCTCIQLFNTERDTCQEQEKPILS